jgi:uncharacterized protein YkwD
MKSGVSILPKVRNIIFLLLVAGGLWHFYGETFKQFGVQGVFEEIRSDVNGIKENPEVMAAFETLNKEFQLLISELTVQLSDKEQPIQKNVEKPTLDSPSEQTFSVHNVELGDDRSEVEGKVGTHKRSSLNEYGVNWVTYHDNYQNFFMVAYNQLNKVSGLYTNQDLVSSTKDITFKSSRDIVLSKLNQPLKSIRKGLVSYQIQNNQEYDTFLIDNHFVTIFYDKHENNTVTAIQIISGELEKQKAEYFTDPSEELKEGFEYQLFDLTNAARVNHGLSILSWEESVRETARNHSKDMADNNYFNHTNLEGQSPFDRMKEDDIAFRMAGENLATGQLSSIFAHEGLMNSLGHRENILQSGFESIGVGVAFNEESRPYYTENFLTQ